VRVVSSNRPDEWRQASEGADSRASLPVRAGSPDRATSPQARAELRDRETYYAELRSAVKGEMTDGESGDDMAVRLGDTWT
jgi:hypothetical protein